MKANVPTSSSVDDILAHINRKITPNSRLMCAIAGPPGVGKSTLSEQLVNRLNEERPGLAALIPMDGFHYDDCVLSELRLSHRKGSPPSFDVDGLISMLKRLRANEGRSVAIPTFDRRLEISRAGARLVEPTVEILIIEGNYLLLDEDGWRDLRGIFDLTAMVTAERAILERRLIDRWLSFGFSMEDAVEKVLENDMPNVDVVISGSLPANLMIESG